MEKVILDCDPGHDDALAIMLAVASPELEVLGITTVAGNQTLEKTTRNALRVLSLIRASVPVAPGAAGPLVRELVIAPEVHGETGLDGAELPEPAASPLEVHAVEFIATALEGSAEPVTLIPTGPLTNIALLLALHPELKEKIQRIVLMGGGVRDFNVTPAAEFNIYVDPEAAKIVFHSGVPITMVGLDATNRALLSPEDIEAIRRMGGPVSRVLGDLLRFYSRANERLLGIPGAPLHDPLAVATVIDPSLVRTKSLHVDVETQGELTRGETVVDLYGVTGKSANAQVVLDLDLPRFKELIFAAIRELDERVQEG